MKHLVLSASVVTGFILPHLLPLKKRERERGNKRKSGEDDSPTFNVHTSSFPGLDTDPSPPSSSMVKKE